MVNEIVLEYLKKHSKKYKIGDLKRKIISSGYSEEEVDDALVALNLKSFEASKEEVPEYSESNEGEIKPGKEPGKEKIISSAKPASLNVFPKASSGDSEWMKIGGISGVVLIILMIIFAALGFMAKVILPSYFYFIFSLIISLAFIFFYYGFVNLGKKYSSKLIKVVSWSFIILAILFVIFMTVSIIFPEVISPLFLGSLINTATSNPLDLNSIFSQLLSSLSSLLIIIILIGLVFAVLNILLGVGLIKLKLQHSKAAGILHIAGAILLVVLPVAFIFDIILLIKESLARNERR